MRRIVGAGAEQLDADCDLILQWWLQSRIGDGEAVQVELEQLVDHNPQVRLEMLWLSRTRNDSGHEQKLMLMLLILREVVQHARERRDGATGTVEGHKAVAVY